MKNAPISDRVVVIFTVSDHGVVYAYGFRVLDMNSIGVGAQLGRRYRQFIDQHALAPVELHVEFRTISDAQTGHYQVGAHEETN